MRVAERVFVFYDIVTKCQREIRKESQESWEIGHARGQREEEEETLRRTAFINHSPTATEEHSPETHVARVVVDTET